MADFNEKEYETAFLPRIREMFHKEGGKLADPFFRYGLDLSTENETEIQATVEAVKQYWAKKIQHPRDGKLFQRLHGDKLAVQQLLEPEVRKQLRAVIIEDRKKEEQVRFVDLDSAVRLIAADGSITPFALTALIKDFTAKGIAESDIRERVKSIPVKAEPDAAPLEEGLSQNVRNEIRKNLAVLEKPDLYTLLNISLGADAESWKRGVDATNETSKKMAAGPTKAAVNALLGICATSILSEPSRYEKARLYDLAEPLEAQVRRAAGASNTVTPVQYTELLRQALECHLPPETAKKSLLWFAHKQGARIQVSDVADPSFVEMCPACRFIIQAQKAADKCPNCSQVLWGSCPECSARVSVNIPNCLQCRFPLSHQAQVSFLLGVFERAYQTKNVSGATEALNQLKAIWPGGRVAKCQNQMDFLKEEREGNYQKYRDAFESRHLYRARELLADLSGASNEPFRDGKMPDELVRSLDTAFVEVNRLLLDAREKITLKSYQKAVLAFERARVLAVDCDEALQGIAQCPPESPLNIRTTVHSNAIDIRWEASPALGEKDYVVVRRTSRPPKSLADGTIVLRGPQLHVEDEQVIAGDVVYYSVFTDRCGTASHPLSTGAILAAFEPSSLNITSRENEVFGTWKPLPTNAEAIVTRCLDRPPSRSGDGTNIAARVNGFQDNQVVNGRDHFYHVAVTYHVSQFGDKSTEGLILKVRPDLPPEPVTNMAMSITATEIVLSWPPPPRGTVQIYALTSVPKNEVLLKATDLASWPQPTAASSANSATFPRLHQSVRHFVPVTVAGEWAALGEVVPFLDVPEVSSLSASNLQGYIQLQWRWAEQCNLALVSWRSDTYPVSPDDPQAMRKSCTRTQYDHSGGFRLTNKGNQSYYFAVFTGVVDADGKVAYGAGLSSGCRTQISPGQKATLGYHIRKAGIWGKKYTLSLDCDASITTVPDMALVCRRDGIQPTAIDQGVEVLRITGATPKSTHNFEIAAFRGYFRLFFVDSASSQGFYLTDPEPGQLRIG